MDIYSSYVRGTGRSKWYLIPEEWSGRTDYWVHNGSVEKVLNKLGKLTKEYIALIHLGTPEVPRCRCGRELAVIKLSQGFRETCLSPECISDNLSKSVANSWKDSNSTFNSPEYRKKLSEGRSRVWADQNSKYRSEAYLNYTRVRLAKSVKDAWSRSNSPYRTEELSKLRSKWLTDRNFKMWNDSNSVFNSPEFRKGMSIRASNRMYRLWEDSNSIFNSPEFRQRKSKIMIDLWNDPNSVFNSLEFRDKLSKRLKERWADPNDLLNSIEYRLKLSEIRSETMLRRWKDSNDTLNSAEYRRCLSDRMKFVWSNPDLYPHFHEVQDILKSKGGGWGMIWDNIQNYEHINFGHSNKYINGRYSKSIKSFNPRYQSGYELRFIELLESDPDVVSYRTQPLSIKYVDGLGNSRRYIPDFLIEYIDGSIGLVEIKPNCFTKLDENLRKWNAAKNFCDKFGYSWDVLTEYDLW